MVRLTRTYGSYLVLSACAAAAAGWLAFFFLLFRSHQLGAAGLFPRDHVFTDFYLYKPTFDVFHTAAFFQPNEGRSGFAYPPLVAPLYRFFYRQHHRISWYLLLTAFLWAVLLGWVSQVYRAMPHSPRRNLAVLLSGLLSYPAVFLLERGNLELFVWAAAAAGVFFFHRRRPSLAAVCFGLAAALKLFPIVLFGLFLGQKRSLRYLLLGLFVMMLSTALAIWYTGPTFQVAARGFLHGVTGFQQHYGTTVRPFELRFDHSLFAVVKVFSALRGRSPASFSSLYFLVCALLFSGIFFLRVLRLPWQNRLLFLSVSMILLPPVSYEYTLVHLYVPLLVLMSLAARSALRPAGVLAWVGLLLLLLPGDLFAVSSWFQTGQVQSLMLLAVAVCTAFPWMSPAAAVMAKHPLRPWPEAAATMLD